MKKREYFIISLIMVWCIVWSVNSIAATYNPMVEKAQKQLTELSYNPGPVDGKMGKRQKRLFGNFKKTMNYQEQECLMRRRYSI